MKLNALFSDGAVFQRRGLIPVFGKTDPESIVEVTFNGRNFFGMAGSDGSFLLRMPPMEAGGPFTLQVRNTRTGDSAEVKDILIGEVWLASGQSNMEFPLHASPAQLPVFAAENTAPEEIRMFSVPRHFFTARETDVCSCPVPENLDEMEANPNVWKHEYTPRWLNTTPDNLIRMSAVSLWFAKKLHDELHVPVGIISSSVGGTFVEAWTSSEMLLTNPDIRTAMEDYEMLLSRPGRWSVVDMEKAVSGDHLLFEVFCRKNPPDAGSPQGWGQIGYDDSGWTDFSIPGSWVAGKLAGNGVVWIRKTIDLPESWAGKDLVLHLGGIDKQDAGFFNGECVGATGKDFETQYYNSKRAYKIPGRLVKAGKNVVAVRAFSFIYDGAFTGSVSDYFLALDGSDETVPLGSDWKFRVENDFGIVALPPRSREAMGPFTANSYSILFDSMIAPLIPYGIRGAIWYQGESNSAPSEAPKYERMLGDMIRDWRFRWGRGDFPFIQVCLAGFTDAQDYTDDCGWAVLRECQRRVMRGLPNSGMASAVDVGDAIDIHPQDKQTVGTRLALWALENTYAVPGVVGLGPEIREVFRDGEGRLRLVFDNSDPGGMVFKDGMAPERAFYVAGADGKFVQAASVTVENNTLIVSVPAVTAPVKVRYAWSANPMEVLCLYNTAGLPATPFEMSI